MWDQKYGTAKIGKTVGHRREGVRRYAKLDINNTSGNVIVSETGKGSCV